MQRSGGHLLGMSYVDEIIPLPFLFCVMLGNQQTGNDVLAATAANETLGILQHSEQIFCGQLPACE